MGKGKRNSRNKPRPTSASGSGASTGPTDITTKPVIAIPAHPPTPATDGTEESEKGSVKDVDCKSGGLLKETVVNDKGGGGQEENTYHRASKEDPAKVVKEQIHDRKGKGKGNGGALEGEQPVAKELSGKQTTPPNTENITSNRNPAQVGDKGKEEAPGVSDEGDGAPKSDTKDKDTPVGKELELKVVRGDEFGPSSTRGEGTGRSEKRNSETSVETREIQSDNLHHDIGSHLTKTTPETRELKHINLGEDEIGYNPGNGDDRDRRDPLGQDITGTVRATLDGPFHMAVTKKPSLKAPPGANDLENIGISGDSTYITDNDNDLGEGEGESPARAHVQDLQSNQAPETRGLGVLPSNGCDINLQDTRTPPETQELRHMELKEGDFGYNVGRGEEGGRIRLDEDSTENPGASRARRRASVQSGSSAGGSSVIEGGDLMGGCRSSTGSGIAPPTSELFQGSNSADISSFPDERTLTRGDASTNSIHQIYQHDPLSEARSNLIGPEPRAKQAIEGNTHKQTPSYYREIPKHENLHKETTPHEQPSNSGAAITLDQLEQALNRSKKEILDSIESHHYHPSNLEERQKQLSANISQLGSRLGKMESDLDFIRKQISSRENSGIASGVTVLPQEFVNPSRVIPASPTNYGGWVGRKVDWSMIRFRVVVALGFVALGGILGPVTRQGRGWVDNVAEWLFKEGRAQRAVV